MLANTRILILEHDLDDIALLEYELQKSGVIYTTEIVQTGKDFESKLIEFKPDIILSDYSLPGFDGIEAFALRQRICPEIPFIFVSGAIGEENSVELIKNGVTDYVLKDKMYTLVLKLNRALLEYREKHEKIEAEKNLIRKEKLLAEAQAVAKIGNWEIDLLTWKQTWSDEMYNIYGISDKSALPTKELFLSFVNPEDVPHILKKLDDSYATYNDSSFNFRFIDANGELKNGRSEWKFEFDNSGMPLRQYGIMQDITERTKIEEEILQKNIELRNLSSHLQSVREEERTHIAREIHDELGQQLTALKMDIGWLVHKLGIQEYSINEKFEHMFNLSDNIINTVRRISSELRPAIIDDLGLLAALEWKCNDFEEKTGIPCSFVSKVSERDFGNSFGINVYRILQETLTNVSRHAKASSVSVFVNELNNEFIMEIADDGVGFPKVREGKTLGILGMNERAALLGGEFIIEGIKNKGTFTRVILPVTNENTDS